MAILNTPLEPVTYCLRVPHLTFFVNVHLTSFVIVHIDFLWQEKMFFS